MTGGLSTKSIKICRIFRGTYFPLTSGLLQSKTSNRMNIFVTGITGYIGEKLALTLAEEGHRIHALVRTPSKVRVHHPNIKVFVGELSDKESIVRAAENCEVMFHLAAFARVWDRHPEKYFEENVQGTRNILDIALRTNVRKFVFTSTAGVIGPSGDQPADEETIRKVDFFNEYESSKALAETAVQDFVRKGLHAVIVSPPRVYGPGRMTQSNAVSLLVKKYISGKWRLMPGDGNTTGSYAYIDDIVRGHILAMEKGRAGEKYILGGVNVTYKELFDTIQKISKTNYKLFRLPFFMVQMFANSQLLMASLFHIQPLVTPKWSRKYMYNWSLSSEKARVELGYRITPLKEGLTKTIDWLKSTKNL